MAGDLPGELAADLLHRPLHERVPDPVDVSGSAVRGDGVGDGAAGADVVEDVGPRDLLQDELGEQRRQEISVDELALVVDEEAAVGVAVPGDPDVGPLGPDSIDDELAVLGQERIRFVVGEVAVGDPVGGGQLDRELVEHRADHLAGHPVAAVDDDLQRLQGVDVDEREGPLAELGRDVDAFTVAAAGSVAEPGEDQVADRGDPGVAGESQRALADELHTGVGLGVVRRGDHGPAVELPLADHEIEHLRADHPGIEHVSALGDQSLTEATRHLRGLQPHVAADADAKVGGVLSAQVGEDPGERAAEQKSGVAVHLVAVQAADVIGLEDSLGDRPRSTVVVCAQVKPPVRAS